MAASITSAELNYLVFRYLHESGFTHSSFAFGYEASINKCPIDGSLVPPGALINFVQKGLQYLDMEANLSNVDSDVDEDFSFLQLLDLITKDINELRHTLKERKKNDLKKAEEKELDKGYDGAHGLGKDRVKQVRKKEHEKDMGRIEKKPREKEYCYQNGKQVDTNHEDQKNVRHEENGVYGGKAA